MEENSLLGAHPLGFFLLENDFEYDADASTAHIESVEELELNRGGEYRPQGCYRSGLAMVKIEQNTDTRQEGGMSMATTYPSVAVVEGPKGRVACSADDFELVLRMVQELS
jgi:hypothetical protein